MTEFPPTWRRIRAKHLYRVVDERGVDGSLPLLAVSIHHGVVPREALTDDEPRADDLANYKHCAAGDIVINRMRAFQGAVGVAREAGIVSPDYVVLRMVDGVDVRYFHHLFRSRWFVSEMTARLRGIGSVDQGNVRTPRINVEDLGQILLALPSLRLQGVIAEFLDAEIARIDDLMRGELRLIQLLEERWRSALWSEFDPSSGVRLKHLLSAPLAYGVLVPQHDEDGVPMLRITDLRSGHVKLGTVTRIPLRQSLEYRRTILAAGDLVASVVGTLGRSIEVGTELVGCNLNRALARVQLQPDVPTALVRFWFESDLFAKQAQAATSGDSAQPTLGLGDMKNFLIGLPVSRSGWASLATRLEKRRVVLDAIIGRLNRQVDRLRERREALITAAVAGELDLSMVAA